MATPHVKAFHYPRGRKVDLRKQMHRRAQAMLRHGPMALDFPVANDVSYFAPEDLDCGDQQNCGSCFYCSACKVCSKRLVQAGRLPNDDSKGMLAWQTNLDSCPGISFGGCDGGDEGEVIDFIKTHGLPTTADYGPYTASSGSCKLTSSMTLYKVNDYGYCDPTIGSGGVASTQLMKNCIKAMGAISIAAAAGGDWDNLTEGKTIVGTGTGVNHAIMFTGWDDNHDNGDGTKGAFCLENQWSTSWGYVINGKGGRAWCKYGADAAGTEAIWIDGGTPVTPIIPPGPLPPWVLQPGQESAIIKPQERSIINITVNLNFPKCGCK